MPRGRRSRGCRSRNARDRAGVHGGPRERHALASSLRRELSGHDAAEDGPGRASREPADARHDREDRRGQPRQRHAAQRRHGEGDDRGTTHAEAVARGAAEQVPGDHADAVDTGRQSGGRRAEAAPRDEVEGQEQPGERPERAQELAQDQPPHPRRQVADDRHESPCHGSSCQFPLGTHTLGGRAATVQGVRVETARRRDGDLAGG